jgi:GNAT superfamily N-acetyltransferase
VSAFDRDREMVRLVERSQQDATSTIATIWEPIADGGAGFENPGSYMNRCCGLGVDGPVTSADLDRVVAFYDRHGVDARVELSAYADPSAFEGLATRGFVLKHLEHVYARAIEDEDLPSEWPAGITIERVDRDDEATLRAYLDLGARGFLPEGAVIAEAYLAAGLRGARLPTSDSFVAKHEGRVIGVGGIGVRLGMSTLFGAVVAKDFRRRGIQRALIAARLVASRERGARFANIRCLPGIATERNAMRLGFRLLSARVVLVRPVAR